jgi:uncharacterized membrane protein YjgN (DUF898 family)
MEYKNYQFEFTGNGFDFFKIWIVNILLTVITLGFYSPWAKVRTNRWFYSNTILNGDSFVYLASPWQILKGRLIAVGFFIIYIISTALFPILSLLFVLGLFLLFPFILVKFMKFQAKYSSYRGITFDFVGGYVEALKAYLFLPIGVVFTLGLLAPYTIKKQVEFLANNTYFGSIRGDFSGTTELYWKIFFFYLAMVMLLILPGFLGLSGVFVLLIPLAYIGFLLGGIFAKVVKTNTMYNYTRFENITFASSMKTTSLAFIYTKNTILSVLTLGLYIPFAMVNLAKYKAQTLKLQASDFEHFIAREGETQSATGMEVADIFDLDIS